MNTTYLAAVMALGMNPAEPAAVVETATPVPTPVPVLGTPFVQGRTHVPAQMSAQAGWGVSTALALGQHPREGASLLLLRESVVPAQAGIVGPVYRSALSAQPPGERVQRPRITDLRQG